MPYGPPSSPKLNLPLSTGSSSGAGAGLEHASVVLMIRKRHCGRGIVQGGAETRMALGRRRRRMLVLLVLLRIVLRKSDGVADIGQRSVEAKSEDGEADEVKRHGLEAYGLDKVVEDLGEGAGADLGAGDAGGVAQHAAVEFLAQVAGDAGAFVAVGVDVVRLALVDFEHGFRRLFFHVLVDVGHDCGPAAVDHVEAEEEHEGVAEELEVLH